MRQLQALSDFLPIGIFSTDTAGNCLYVSKAFETVAAHLALDMTGAKWWQILPALEREKAEDEWKRCAERGQPYRALHCLLRADGEPVLVEVKTQPMVAQDLVTGHAGTLEDVTEASCSQPELHVSQARLRLIIDNIPALVTYTSNEERILFINRQYEQAYGIAPGNLGMTTLELLGPEVYAQSKPYLDRALKGIPAHFERLSNRSGAVRWERVRYVPDIDSKGNVCGFFSLVEDITELKAVQDTLQKSEKMLLAVTDNLPAFVSYVDANECYQFNNSAYGKMLRRPLPEIIGKHVREVHGEEMYRQYKPHIDRALAGEQHEFKFSTEKNGITNYFSAVYVPHFDESNRKKVVGFYAITQNITPLKNVELQLRELARFDSLTGLPNRNQLNEKFVEAIARSRRSRLVLAVIFLDIDHFKQINDTFGHHGGDLVLKELAQHLLGCVRKTDTVARLAGDEFVILLEDIYSRDESYVVANKITDAITRAIDIQGSLYQVTVSIGITIRRRDQHDPAILLKRADEALYRAKAIGRNRFECIP